MGLHRIVTAVVPRQAALAGVLLSVMALTTACLPAPPPGTSHSPSGYLDSVAVSLNIPDSPLVERES